VIINNSVILSVAGTSRSEVPAESKDPYTLVSDWDASGNSPHATVNQPKISALMNYRLDGFSVERLMHFLNGLDRDIEIVIRKKPRSRRRWGSRWRNLRSRGWCSSQWRARPSGAWTIYEL